MNTCRSKGCRFSNTHVTLGHRCGVCNEFGHGKMECGKLNNISTLRELSRNDKIPEKLQCEVHNCIYKWSHIKSAHHCGKCSGRGHGTSYCPQSRGLLGNSRRSSSIFSGNDYIKNRGFPDDEDSEQAAFTKMGSTDGKVYVTIPDEMGCSFWYRRTSRDSLLEKLFMHYDDWGQYGMGKVAEYTSFINGYTQI